MGGGGGINDEYVGWQRVFSDASVNPTINKRIAKEIYEFISIWITRSLGYIPIAYILNTEQDFYIITDQLT
jgi:hypothetical protein